MAEVASGLPLTKLVQANIDAAGLEAAFTCSCDCDMFPVLSGGGFMTARDLARYGLLFARGAPPTSQPTWALELERELLSSLWTSLLSALAAAACKAVLSSGQVCS
eukprot:SAG22_NODE_101_length_20519_cov_15.588002_15_plen_106_part_00